MQYTPCFTCQQQVHDDCFHYCCSCGRRFHETCLHVGNLGNQCPYCDSHWSLAFSILETSIPALKESYKASKDRVPELEVNSFQVYERSEHGSEEVSKDESSQNSENVSDESMASYREVMGERNLGLEFPQFIYIRMNRRKKRKKKRRRRNNFKH